ncbi:MAG: O-antigen ligase family protein [Armatimonadota bacterium]
MRLIRRTIEILMHSFRVAPRRSTADRVTSSALPGKIAQVRMSITPVWRTAIRCGLVLMGFGLFVAAELAVAYSVVNYQSFWWFIAAAFVLVGTGAITIFKPTQAFIGWLVISPIVYYFFQGDLGKGLPPITWDRIVLPFLACSFIVRAIVNRRKLRKISAAEWLFIAFALYSGVNLIFIHNETDTGLIGKFMDYQFMSVVVFFVAKSALKTRKHVMQAFVALLIVGFISAGALIIEAQTGQAWYGWIIGRRIPLTWGDIGQGRGQGLWFIPHVSQIFCSMMAFIAYHFAHYAKHRIAKLAYYIAAITMIFAVYYAYSRTGYIAFVFTVIVLPLVVPSHRMRYYRLAGVIALLLALSLPLMMSNKDFVNRMTQDTVSIRIHINDTNIALIKDNLLTGVGFGKVPSAFWYYVDNLAHRNSIDSSRLTLHRPNNPHNWHLQVLGEEGLIGGLLYYGAILAFVISALKMSRRLPKDDALGGNIPAIVAVATVANLIVLNFYGGPKMPYPIYMFWLVFALVIRLKELRTEECVSDDSIALVKV